MLDRSYIKNYYLRKEVKKEILDYVKNRWIALEFPGKMERVFIRYWRDTKDPIEIKDEYFYKRLFVQFPNLRTIYATIHIYKEVKKDKLKDLENIKYVTPIFDIDGTLKDFEIIKNVAEIIVSSLEKYGIYKSIYLKWSGRGIHIHIHEKAFSEKIRTKYHPLDIAYSIVDFILKKKKDEIRKEMLKAQGGEREFKVENKIDIQRVFTVPLSFHRFLDYVCICLKPNELNSFDLSWADPNNFRHNPKWREYEEGEGDQLAEIALKESKSYITEFLKQYAKRSIKHGKITIERRKTTGQIGRFQVMGLLQAARYYLLKGDLDKAKSFGLNRAIFYAWCKYYRPRYKVSKRRLAKIFTGEEEKMKFEEIGNEKAPIDKNTGLFIIGDKVQTPKDFDKEIAEKINQIVPFELAWKAALDYLKRFPKSVLEDQHLFYEKVYKPVRDEFDKIIRKYIEKKSQK